MKLLDTVALTHDIEAFGLKAGDIGAIVEMYEPPSIEVEFVDSDGDLIALLVLEKSDVRKPTKDELTRLPKGKPTRRRSGARTG